MKRFLAVAICLILTSVASPEAIADPGGVVAGNGPGRVNVRGEAVKPGSAHAGSNQGQPSNVVSVACGTESQSQLGRLGDLDPTISNQTCSDQTIVCRNQARQTHTDLDPIVSVEQQPDGTWQYAGNTCAANSPARITAAMVRQSATRLIPTATIGVAPHNTTLVNIDTVLWANTPRHRQLPPATILGHHVTISIALDHITWTYGDGTTNPHGNAGKPYDPTHDPCRTTTCPHYNTHTYRTTGTVTITAQATWHATYTVAGTTPIDIPGTLDGPTSTTRLTIKQARAVLVPNPGESR